MKLYFVRHPQTLWNKKRLFQGSKEGPVTKEGKLATSEFIKSIKAMDIDYLYYADNKRCGYLAKEIVKIFPKLVSKRDPRINERSFGEYEGTPEGRIAKITNFDPNNFEARYEWKGEGGESMKDISIRVKDFLKELKEADVKDKNAFVITSGGVMKVVLYILSIKTLGEALQTKYKNLEMMEINI